MTEGRQEVMEAQRMDIHIGPWWSGHTFAPEQAEEKLNLILLFLLRDWNYNPYLGTGLAPPAVTVRGSRPPGARTKSSDEGPWAPADWRLGSEAGACSEVLTVEGGRPGRKV